MNTKSMKIPYAFSPIVKATLDDGSVAELAIIGNKGGNLLVKNISENVVYEIRVTNATVPNMLVFDVVWSNEAPKSYTVTVTDSAANVSAVSPQSKEVERGESATFTLTYASGKTDSDVKASSGSISGTTLTVSNVSENVTVTLTDLYTVSVTNSSTAVASVTPETKHLEAGSNAVFVLTFAEGKSAADVEVSSGTITEGTDNTYLTVSDIQADTTVTITDKV